MSGDFDCKTDRVRLSRSTECNKDLKHREEDSCRHSNIGSMDSV